MLSIQKLLNFLGDEANGRIVIPNDILSGLAAVGVLLITAGTVLMARFGYDTCMSGIGGWNAIDKRKK